MAAAELLDQALTVLTPPKNIGTALLQSVGMTAYPNTAPFASANPNTFTNTNGSTGTSNLVGSMAAQLPMIDCQSLMFRRTLDSLQLLHYSSYALTTNPTVIAAISTSAAASAPNPAVAAALFGSISLQVPLCLALELPARDRLAHRIRQLLLRQRMQKLRSKRHVQPRELVLAWMEWEALATAGTAMAISDETEVSPVIVSCDIGDVDCQLVTTESIETKVEGNDQCKLDTNDINSMPLCLPVVPAPLPTDVASFAAFASHVQQVGNSKLHLI